MQMPTKSGTIRVEIDDFNELHTVDELKKPVKIGDVEWTFGVFSETSARTAHVRHLGFLLHCNKSLRSNLWTVSASIQFKMCKAGHPEISSKSEMINMEFDANRKTLEIPNFMNWNEATSVENGYVSDNTAVVEADIHVECIKGIHLEDQKKTFEESEEHLTDVVLVVNGGKKIHVAKKILALQSGYFKKLFYEESVDGAEYSIDDVEESQFVDFLNLIYRSSLEIDDKNVDSILKLAHRFEIAFLIENCEQFLINSSQVHIVDKLKYAEIYKFSHLQNRCLSQLKTTQDVLDLAVHERHKTLGSVTSEALFQRISEISREKKDEPEGEEEEVDDFTGIN